MNDAKITKIALTGGPCAGKTTIMTEIVTHFTPRGYRVVVAPESATLLIQAGFPPTDFPEDEIYHFQNSVYGLIDQMERSLEYLGQHCPQPVLMVCDRGMMDGKAFCSQKVWEQILQKYGVSELEIRDARYQAVIHLVTAAEGAEAFYTTANNRARWETPALAREVDRRLLAAWKGHPHLYMIDNSTDFGGKIKRSLSAIENILGIAGPT